MASAATVLVVDDIEDIRALLQHVLSHHGFNVLAADGGAQMDAHLNTSSVDVIVLDSVMPGEDGPSICKRLKSTGGPPVLMLSAESQSRQKIRGLECGAEDYMVKPFNVEELIMRLRVILRRANEKSGGPEAGATRLFFGWRLSLQNRKLTSPAGKILQLSAAEFAFLSVLLDAPDKPLKRAYILERMADTHDFTTVRGLDALVSRLRQKLIYADASATGDLEIVQTVYGVGYMLRPR